MNRRSDNASGDKRSGKLPQDAPRRLHKAIADAGIASRRRAEAMIEEGRVTVNGKTAVVGQPVTSRDEVAIDGRRIRLVAEDQAPRVLIYKKRVGELVTRDDPDGRRTVFRKLPKLEDGRWIAVGRLDINTSGLLLLTNHGELARRLMHPSFGILREYAVRVLGTVDGGVLERLRKGVMLEDGFAKFESIVSGEPTEPEADGAANHWFHVVVSEGRNRLVRRLLESQDLQVSRLMRVGYGPVKLPGGIRSGGTLELEAEEVAEVMASVGLEPSTKKPTAKRSPGLRPKPSGGRRVR